MNSLLCLRSLKTYFYKKDGILKAVDGIDLEITCGQTLALVGESGSGKTITALSIFRLVPSPGKIVGGAIEFKGRNLLTLSEKEMTAVRGRQMGLILQDPLSALNPVMRVGEQIAEVFRHHFSMKNKPARHAALALMERVKLPNVQQNYRAYPHQLSGGMRQRVLIAMALACRPALVIADEPTTALDVSIQSQILSLLKELKDEFQLALLLITHDLGIVARMADQVAVMYAGKIVEQAPVADLFTEPLHPYTQALLRAIPNIDFNRKAPNRDFHLLRGAVPDLMNLPSGCPFHPRCDIAEEQCSHNIPENFEIKKDRYLKCLIRGKQYEKISALPEMV
ncbi:MAG: ABC transporter ATP-binding protein [bacterium]